MMYELFDTKAHPLVVVASVQEHDQAPHPAHCPCGGTASKTLTVVIDGSGSPSLKAAGLLGAVAQLMADDDTTGEDCRMIRRSLAKLLEVTS